ncbi:hypothetical protein SUGI_0920380 [Cryptomeria japonica]|nr:hypothetical protein SUGI_0920380 [Cryptomeria japonica]
MKIHKLNHRGKAEEAGDEEEIQRSGSRANYFVGRSPKAMEPLQWDSTVGGLRNWKLGGAINNCEENSFCCLLFHSGSEKRGREEESATISPIFLSISSGKQQMGQLDINSSAIDRDVNGKEGFLANIRVVMFSSLPNEKGRIRLLITRASMMFVTTCICTTRCIVLHGGGLFTLYVWIRYLLQHETLREFCRNGPSFATCLDKSVGGLLC